jgi:hypothetical protein
MEDPEYYSKYLKQEEEEFQREEKCKEEEEYEIEENYDDYYENEEFH